MLLVLGLVLKYFTIFIAFLIVLLSLMFIPLKLWSYLTKEVCRSTAKLHGKVALVTGGNSGIGLETARDLANRGAKVIIASIEPKNSEEAIADIIRTTGNHNVEYIYLDLANFASIRNFAEDFNNRHKGLDILVNNAGCFGLKKKLTEDGIDLVMQINYFGPFLLTNLLLDKLIVSKPSRIVVVSSNGHHLAKLNLDDMEGLERLHYFTEYANSKLCTVLWTKALAEKLPPGVTVNALHPGMVKTNIYKENNIYERDDISERFPRFLRKILLAMFGIMPLMKTAKEGAQTTIHLCVAEELENVSGGYFSECKPCDVSELAKNDSLIDDVWRKSILITKQSQ